MRSRVFLSLLFASVSAVACGGAASSSAPAVPAASTASSSEPVSPSAPSAPATAGAAASPSAANPNTALDAFFADYDAGVLARAPMEQSERGIKTDYGKWNDFSDEQANKNYEADQAAVSAMRAKFGKAFLDESHRLSFRLFEDRIERQARQYRYRDHRYSFDQMNGAQSQLVAFLINIHKVTNVADAEAYVQRLRGMGDALRQQLVVAKGRAAKGYLPPKWVYPYVLGDAGNVIKGAPFDKGPDSALFADLKSKVAALKLAPDESARLIAAGSAALTESVKPVYLEIIEAMKEMAAQAPTDDGVWRFGDGAAYYTALLKNYTTTELSAEEIHALGLREVTRIHGEMTALIKPLKTTGTLKQLLARMRDRKDLYYPNNAKGRAMYLAATQKSLDSITAKLPQWFNTLPKSALVIKPVEPFREKSAGKAFYSRPAPDGSRPGTYYVNLYDMKAMPSMESEALLYHEGVPGHHLQLAVQTELGDEIPLFRKFGGVTAYSEGWGLYAEKLGKDMGQYTDPVRDFGRLQLELHRAIRLVVDTGLHDKKWTREQAIEYVLTNSAEPRAAAVKAIERYIVNPGQATAYMIGRLKISELRDRASTQLGSRFDVRAFHDVVLKNGPLPLAMLEAEVNRWIESQRG